MEKVEERRMRAKRGKEGRRGCVRGSFSCSFSGYFFWWELEDLWIKCMKMNGLSFSWVFLLGMLLSIEVEGVGR